MSEYNFEVSKGCISIYKDGEFHKVIESTIASSELVDKLTQKLSAQDQIIKELKECVVKVKRTCLYDPHCGGVISANIINETLNRIKELEENN